MTKSARMEQLTVPQIKAQLKAFGLAPGNGRKAELLERLRAAQAADAVEDAILLQQEHESPAAASASASPVVPGLSLPFPLSEISPPPRSPPKGSRHHSPSPDPRPLSHSAAAFIGEPDAFSELVYRPHTLTALLFGGGLLVAWGFQEQEGMDRMQSWAQGMQACACCFLLYATLQFRDSILMRPHPAFWRFVHGAAIIYFLGLVFLFMQPKHWGREWLQAFDSELGKERPAENTKEYATDCRCEPAQHNHSTPFFAQKIERPILPRSRTTSKPHGDEGLGKKLLSN